MTMAPPVKFAGDRMSIRFDRFDQAAYALFLQCKRIPEFTLHFDPETESYTVESPARFAGMLGIEAPPSTIAIPLADFLFEDQVTLTRQALDAKRYAVWSGCGNGKTLIGLEYARHVAAMTKGRVLIVTLNEIVNQWIEESAKFYGDALPLERLKSRDSMKEWCVDGPAGAIGITNYEKFNPGTLAEQVVNECRHLAGVVLDESSRLKGGGGKQKWALIKSMKGVEYKLNLTATPAPNDLIEFASQASFLEKMRTDADIIWTFFTRDPVTTRWTIKPHARAAFFEFMSSWSIYVNDPKRYGWRLDQPDVPKATMIETEIEPTQEQREAARTITADSGGQISLFQDGNTNAIQRAKLSQVAKGFVYSDKGKTITRIPSGKPAAVAKIIHKEAAAGHQVLVWTIFDAETDILAEHLKGLDGVEFLTGSVSTDIRPSIIERFRRGETRVLVSRTRMLGFGMNFQFVKAMIFSGWTDSFEDLYQAVRRAVRFGQADSVRVYFPVIRELEGDTFDNIRRKEAEFERSIVEMEDCYIRARNAVMSPVKGAA